MVTATLLGPEAEIDELTHSFRNELYEHVIDKQMQPSEAQITKMMRYADLVVTMGGTHEEFYKTAINLLLTTAERQLGRDRATGVLADVVTLS